MNDNTPDGWVSLDDLTLGISLRAPAGWSRTTTPVFPLQLLAPPRDGFRSSCSFSLEQFGPPTPAGLQVWLAHTADAQAKDYEGFVELGREELEVDNRPAVIQHYAWTPEELGHSLEQLLILVVTQPGVMLEADAAALQSHAEEDLAVIRQIVASVRFLSPTPS